jgi:predicted AAA+ superfamily ATPase
VAEIRKLADYASKRWDFFYYASGESEIDLVLKKPMNETILIEIKSTSRIDETEISRFARLSEDFPDSRSYCFSLDPVAKKIGHVQCLHWQDGLRVLGLVPS